MNCDHDDPAIIRLTHGRTTISFCRACLAWVVSLHADSMIGGIDRHWSGQGLYDYQSAITTLADCHPAWDATFLFDLGGHASEVAS